MELPFALSFLKKVDAFQVLKKLDRDFENRIRKYNGVVSTWEVEKKILLWANNQHFHLGSPLTVDELRSRKSIALKWLEGQMSARTEAIAESIKPVDATVFETDFEKFFTDIDKRQTEQVREVSDSRRVEVDITPQESDKAGVRETFGNLVSRGYAAYYPIITKVVTGYDTGGGRLGARPIYEDVDTNQSNCEGVYITGDGLIMGELISDVSKQESIGDCNNNSEIGCAYKEITGADSFLYRSWWRWFIYQGLIWISYAALIVVIWLVVVGLKDIIISILRFVMSDGIF